MKLAFFQTVGHRFIQSVICHHPEMMIKQLLNSGITSYLSLVFVQLMPSFYSPFKLYPKFFDALFCCQDHF